MEAMKSPGPKEAPFWDVVLKYPWFVNFNGRYKLPIGWLVFFGRKLDGHEDFTARLHHVIDQLLVA